MKKILQLTRKYNLLLFGALFSLFATTANAQVVHVDSLGQIHDNGLDTGRPGHITADGFPSPCTSSYVTGHTVTLGNHEAVAMTFLKAADDAPPNFIDFQQVYLDLSGPISGIVQKEEINKVKMVSGSCAVGCGTFQQVNPRDFCNTYVADSDGMDLWPYFFVYNWGAGDHTQGVSHADSKCKRISVKACGEDVPLAGTPIDIEVVDSSSVVIGISRSNQVIRVKLSDASLEGSKKYSRSTGGSVRIADIVVAPVLSQDKVFVLGDYTIGNRTIPCILRLNSSLGFESGRLLFNNNNGGTNAKAATLSYDSASTAVIATAVNNALGGGISVSSVDTTTLNMEWDNNLVFNVTGFVNHDSSAYLSHNDNFTMQVRINTPTIPVGLNPTGLTNEGFITIDSNTGQVIESFYIREPLKALDRNERPTNSRLAYSSTRKTIGLAMNKHDASPSNRNLSFFHSGRYIDDVMSADCCNNHICASVTVTNTNTSAGFTAMDTDTVKLLDCPVNDTINMPGPMVSDVCTSLSGQFLTVFRGNQINGSVDDMRQSDDIRTQFTPGFTLNAAEAPVWLEFEKCGVPLTTATLTVSVESHAGTPGLEKTLELYNFQTNTYDVVLVDGESFNTDEVMSYVVPAIDIPKYVSPPGEVVTRIGWRKVGFTINFPWKVNIDKVIIDTD